LDNKSPLWWGEYIKDALYSQTNSEGVKIRISFGPYKFFEIDKVSE